MSGMQRLLARLLCGAVDPFWRTCTYLLQLFDSVAVVSRGQLVSFEAMDGATLAAHRLPHSLVVAPLAVLAGHEVQLQLAGCHISNPDCSLVVKGGGSLLHLGGVGASKACGRAGAAGAAAVGGSGGSSGGGCCGSCSFRQPAAAADTTAAAVSAAGGGCGREVLSCTVTPRAGGRVALLWVEVARGAFLSQARPVLVVEDPQLAQVGAGGKWQLGRGRAACVTAVLLAGLGGGGVEVMAWWFLHYNNLCLAVASILKQVQRAQHTCSAVL